MTNYKSPHNVHTVSRNMLFASMILKLNRVTIAHHQQLTHTYYTRICTWTIFLHTFIDLMFSLSHTTHFWSWNSPIQLHLRAGNSWFQKTPFLFWVPSKCLATVSLFAKLLAIFCRILLVNMPPIDGISRVINIGQETFTCKIKNWVLNVIIIIGKLSWETYLCYKKHRIKKIKI